MFRRVPLRLCALTARSHHFFSTSFPKNVVKKKGLDNSLSSACAMTPATVVALPDVASFDSFFALNQHCASQGKPAQVLHPQRWINLTSHVPRCGAFLAANTTRSFTRGARVMVSAFPTTVGFRYYHISVGAAVGSQTSVLRAPNLPNTSKSQLQAVSGIEHYKSKEEEEEQKRREGDEEDTFRKEMPGYLPFPLPFHTINIIMLLFITNILCYLVMTLGNNDTRDFIVEHMTVSHENFRRVYPIFTNMFYQDNLIQLLIDCWLLRQFGKAVLTFLGNTRMTFFAVLCTTGSCLLHVGRQHFALHCGLDELEVRGRCYGPNPTIMGLVAVEGLILRHLNFIQQPPVPFLVLTAFVMVIDVWRIFTMQPEEHSAATGGALMAYLFWALPTRMLGLDKLTATF